MSQLPFTPEQFLGVFSRYNTTVFPLQLILVLLALAAVVLAVRTPRGSDSVISGILGFFWLWMGVVYHLLFFSGITPAAYLFGALFIGQGLLLLHAGICRQATGFHLTADRFSAAGLAFILYSLAVYPLIGTVAGHPYPQLPSFGLPCPTTIFTFGMLLLADRKVPWSLVAIPLIWSGIGFFAAYSLGIVEDYGLLLAGILGALLIGMKNRTFSRG